MSTVYRVEASHTLLKRGGGADGYIRGFKPSVFGRLVPDSIADLYR